MKDLKYEYLLHTWGGFYNDVHKKVHGQEEGYHYFDSKGDRDEYLHKLKTLSEDLNAHGLATDITEGYNTRIPVVLHRVVRYKEDDYYSEKHFPPGYPYEAVKFMAEYKWNPGFNDYDNNEVEIVQEWVTGAFDINEE